MALSDSSQDPRYAWESHSLKIEHCGKTLELSIGLRKRNGDVHWWENCRLIQQRAGDDCLSIEMGGGIPLTNETFDELMQHPGYTNPLLHKHNWLNGNIYMRLHSNGVCEAYLRHVNSKFVDDGGDLEDAVPVVGLRIQAKEEELQKIMGEWDGEISEFSLGGVSFDLSEAARLATGKHPGRFDLGKDGRIVWQPYEGIEVYGGVCPETLTGDPFIFRAENRMFPRGMARTLRFSLSLSDRSPRVVRYLAPAWWHGVCEDFLPEPLLPVSNAYDVKLNEARTWIRKHSIYKGFEDGAVARHDYLPKEIEGRIYHEAGWEGDTPYTQFLSAWRTGDGEEYLSAMRSAYHFVDIAVDHSSKMVRMHGFADSKVAQPMSRMMAAIVAYLETGDDFLRSTAEAVTMNAYWTHKNSWPRMAVGRDASYLRSAVLLYRYFGEDYFRKIARDGALDTVRSQRPDGSFGDQGGGTRLHGWNAYMIKPWMGLLALNGVIDYLEMSPDEHELRDGVIRFADWLMSERRLFEDKRSWCYQHDFNNRRRLYDFYKSEWIELPTGGNWHHETLGRLLAFTSIITKEAKYFDAWAESYSLNTTLFMDHAVNATLQFIPWVQAKLWNARLTPDSFTVEPLDFGARTPGSADIMTPDGLIHVTRRETQKTEVYDNGDPKPSSREELLLNV